MGSRAKSPLKERVCRCCQLGNLRGLVQGPATYIPRGESHWESTPAFPEDSSRWSAPSRVPFTDRWLEALDSPSAMSLGASSGILRLGRVAALEEPSLAETTLASEAEGVDFVNSEVCWLEPAVEGEDMSWSEEPSSEAVEAGESPAASSCAGAWGRTASASDGSLANRALAFSTYHDLYTGEVVWAAALLQRR